MLVNFAQGIISYPTAGPTQNFLQKTGLYVTLSATSGRTDITFAQRDTNYLFSESVTVNNAWGPVPNGVDAWLYWDLSQSTGQRTFGFTLVQPVFGASTPVVPVEDQHWFDTTNKIMFVYTNGVWQQKIRVFAAKLNTATFSPMGSIGGRPFAGTQVGLVGQYPTGYIVFDDSGKPVRRSNGTLFNTEVQFYVNDSPVNTMKLDANVLQAVAIENMAAFSVVTWTDFNQIGLANYNDTAVTMIGMLMADVLNGNIQTVVAQGTVTNNDWNWSQYPNPLAPNPYPGYQNVGINNQYIVIPAGHPLWIEENGELTFVDPFTVNPTLYPVKKPPIAKVVSQNQIMFDQGMGAIGADGAAGPPGSNVPATTTQAGVSKISVAAVNPLDPVVVGDNDPRLSGAPFAPASHTHTATQVSITPTGNITGPTVQLGIQQLETNKVNRAGDTMTGSLTLNADPTLALEAATKQYVDAGVSTATSNANSRVLRSGDTMTGLLILSGDPVVALGAATKQYVDNLIVGTYLPLAGGTMTGVLTLNADPTNPLEAATKQYVDNSIPGVDTITNTTYLNGSGQIAVNYITLNSVYLRIDGTNAMTANLNLGTHKIINVVNPTNPQDAATKDYVDNAFNGSLYVLRAGDSMTGSLSLGSNLITNVLDPVNAQDAATKNYVDTALSSQTIPYDITFFAGGPMPPLNAIAGGMQAVRAVFIPNTPVHYAHCTIAPTATADYDIVVQTPAMSNTVIGTVQFPASSFNGTVTITSGVTVTAGQTILLVCNTAIPDATIENVFVSLAGCALATPCSMV